MPDKKIIPYLLKITIIVCSKNVLNLAGIKINYKINKKWKDAYCILAIDSFKASRFSGCFSKYSLTGAR